MGIIVLYLRKKKKMEQRLVILTFLAVALNAATYIDTGFSKSMVSCTLAMTYCTAINGDAVERYSIPGGTLANQFTTSCLSAGGCTILANYISNDGTRTHVYTSNN